MRHTLLFNKHLLKNRPRDDTWHTRHQTRGLLRVPVLPSPSYSFCSVWVSTKHSQSNRLLRHHHPFLLISKFRDLDDTKISLNKTKRMLVSWIKCFKKLKPVWAWIPCFLLEYTLIGAWTSICYTITRNQLY